MACLASPNLDYSWARPRRVYPLGAPSSGVCIIKANQWLPVMVPGSAPAVHKGSCYLDAVWCVAVTPTILSSPLYDVGGPRPAVIAELPNLVIHAQKQVA